MWCFSGSGIHDELQGLRMWPNMEWRRAAMHRFGGAMLQSPCGRCGLLGCPSLLDLPINLLNFHTRRFRHASSVTVQTDFWFSSVSIDTTKKYYSYSDIIFIASYETGDAKPKSGIAVHPLLQGRTALSWTRVILWGNSHIRSVLLLQWMTWLRLKRSLKKLKFETNTHSVHRRATFNSWPTFSP